MRRETDESTALRMVARCISCPARGVFLRYSAAHVTAALMQMAWASASSVGLPLTDVEVADAHVEAYEWERRQHRTRSQILSVFRASGREQCEEVRQLSLRMLMDLP
jgi:hypothetical protein